MPLWKAKTVYTISARLPARYHGISSKKTTAGLARENQKWAEQYSEALQACLEGERAVHASELNEPLMMWNATWKRLNGRLAIGLPWRLRKQILRQNRILLEQPSQDQLWHVVNLWMKLRERADHSLDQMHSPVVAREHFPQDWFPGGPGGIGGHW